MSRRKLSRRKTAERFRRNLFIILVFIFLFLPIFVLVLYSFNTSKMNILFEGFTFDWYSKLFENENLLDAFKNTLLIAIISTLISTIIGTASAIGLKKYNFFGKNLIEQLIYIPIVMPEIVLGIALLSSFTLVNLNLGLFSVLLSHIAFSIPFVITSVRSSLDALPKEYEEAAEDLGAGKFKTLFYVLLPLIKSGIVSGALLAFTLSLDDVVISFFTAGPGTNTLPLYIYSVIKTGITPDVNALTTLMLIITATILTVSAFYQSRKITSRGGGA